MGEHATNLEKRIFKAGAFVLLAHLLFKLTGLIQTVCMGRYLPAGTYDVVYAFAFENCIFLLYLVIEEVLGPSVMPLFVSERTKESEEHAWAFVNTVLTLQFIVLSVIAGVLWLAPEAVVSAVTQWGMADSPKKYELAVYSVHTLAPAVIGLSLGTTTYVLLNGYKRFFLAAFGDAMWKFAAVGFLLISVCFKWDNTRMLMWGLVAGSLCKVATHVFGLRDKLRFFRPRLAWSHPSVRRLFWLALPLLLGIIVSTARNVVNNVYILSSIHEEGFLQANSMGRKLQATLLFIIPYTLSIAVFPFFCELVDKDDRTELARLVTRFGRMLLAVFTPIALFVAVAAVPITAVIFKGGFVDSESVVRIAVSLACYTLVLPGAAVEALMMRAFFASRRMWSVTAVGMAFSVVSILISWVGLRVCGEGHELWLLAFIAGGFTLSRTGKCITLVEMLKKNTPAFPFVETLGFMARLGVAAGLASGAGWLLLNRVGAVAALHGRLGDVLKLGIAGSAFTAVYLAAAYALRIGELHELLDVVRDKVRKRA
ncbi:MAG: oligosaccharide flippase family protein [Verrucomicrobiota bacterium]|jgi:putative peptidoglycan lipid II flippase|nr:oligosaccharide flippase family protein [Verrucomicrobiota bacterium]